MAVPLESVVKQLADSGIIAPGKLETFVPPKATPKDGEELLGQLVQNKHLTKFQAQEIYQGRGKSLILGNYTILDKAGKAICTVQLNSENNYTATNENLSSGSYYITGVNNNQAERQKLVVRK